MTADDDRVKVAVAPGEGAPYASEGLWAVPVDTAAGLYRIDNVAFMTDGVSLGDLVRCDVSGENRLVAVELVERSPDVTVAFGLAVPDLPQDAYDARLRRLADRVRSRYGDKVTMESGFGVLSVCVPPDLLDQLFDTVVADCGPDATVDEDQHLLGDWQWFVTSHPEWDAPEPVEGAQALLDRQADVVAVDWPADDPVASRWPDEVKASLREQAATNVQLRRMLDERRYVAAVVPLLRISLVQQHGLDAVGTQPFPIYPSDDPDEQARFDREWAQATGPDGRVRWCADDTADSQFRTILADFGLDPDADPRAPVL